MRHPKNKSYSEIEKFKQDLVWQLTFETEGFDWDHFIQTAQQAKEKSDKILNPLDIFRSGIKVGLQSFAWFEDDVQYVGPCGVKLEEALKRVDEGKYDDIFEPKE